MEDRYTVAMKREEKFQKYYILDEQTNRIVSDSISDKRKAERICKKINREVNKNDAKRNDTRSLAKEKDFDGAASG